MSALSDVLMYGFDGEGQRRLLIEAMLHKSCVGSTVEIEGSGEVLHELSSSRCNGKEYNHRFHSFSLSTWAPPSTAADSFPLLDRILPWMADRLEWLGDKVLGLHIARYMHETLPKLEEGELSTLHGGLISRRRCNEIAMELGLEKFLVYSQHVPEKPGGRTSSRIGSFLEALLGALYLAGGEAAVKVLFEARIHPLLSKMVQEGERNWKGELVELVCKYGLDHTDGSQFRMVDLPPSKAEKASVPWLSCFRVGICIHDQILISAMESSKRKAHQAVSKAFLLELEDAGGEGGALAGLRAKLRDDTRNWRTELLAFLRAKCQLDVTDWRQLKVSELPPVDASETGACADYGARAGVFIHGRLVATATSSTKFLAKRAACRVFLERLEAAENPEAIIDECRREMS